MSGKDADTTCALKTIYEESRSGVQDGDFAAFIRESDIMRQKLRVLLTRAQCQRSELSPWSFVDATVEDSQLSSRSGRSKKSERKCARAGVLVPWEALAEVFVAGSVKPVCPHGERDARQERSRKASGDFEDDTSTQVPSSDSDSAIERKSQEHRAARTGALLSPGLAFLPPKQLSGAPLLPGLELVDTWPSSPTPSVKTSASGGKRLSSRCYKHGIGCIMEPGAKVQIQTGPEAEWISATVLVSDRAAGTYKVRTSDGKVKWAKAESLRSMKNSTRAA
mmetsp:Transcript_94558/g.282384  ORF Transcript_94558/g.282384 Transcript_94558/m.282384 type:complete len:279 (-) Transcript_94558:265-1101(-)